MFKITVEEIRPKDGKEWKRLHDKENFDSKTEPQYGYVHSQEHVAVKVYEQIVDKLFLKGVIEAVNPSCIVISKNDIQAPVNYKPGGVSHERGVL